MDNLFIFSLPSESTMTSFAYFVDLIRHQKLLWKSITKNHELFARIDAKGVIPLESELSLCIKLMTTFLVLSDQNIQLVIAGQNVLRISFFAILNRIVLDNDRFETCFKKIHRVYCFIETQKEVRHPLNTLEMCIVGIMSAFQHLARATRSQNMRPATSMSEAHANASATLKLQKLFSEKQFESSTSHTEHIFRDFDLTLCSNTETSVLNSKANAVSNRKRSRGIHDNRIAWCSTQLLELSRSVDQLREATVRWTAQTLTQARLWHSTIDASLFSYGVERYVEKCSGERFRMSQISDELSRVLLRLAEAGYQIKKLGSNPDAETIKSLTLELANSALGYVAMALWWWFQEAMGFDQVRRLRCLRKLDTPTRENFQSVERNQSIIDEYNRSLGSMRHLLSPKL